jgi:apolipoprotein N-acyltransferase
MLISPNICYESVLPHVIRRQINTLQAEGKEPDVLVNLTNDGWFWGSSELDLHLACGIFRAVECRKPPRTRVSPPGSTPTAGSWKKDRGAKPPRFWPRSA